jgi:hypothetical protein
VLTIACVHAVVNVYFSMTAWFTIAVLEGGLWGITSERCNTVLRHFSNGSPIPIGSGIINETAAAIEVCWHTHLVVCVLHSSSSAAAVFKYYGAQYTTIDQLLPNAHTLKIDQSVMFLACLNLCMDYAYKHTSQKQQYTNQHNAHNNESKAKHTA